MYSYLSGILKAASPERVILDLHGVGYKVEIPLSLFSKLPAIGSSLTLHVTFIVRELFQGLYGFKEEEERDLFEILIELSGVGPKLALSILGHLEPQELYRIVLNQEIDTLSKVPGIGKKKGERVLVELKGKMPERHPRAEDYILPLHGDALHSDATRALVHLGYPHLVAQKAVQKGLALHPDANLSALISEALRHV